MERPEPGLIKWSPNPVHDTFIHVNLQQRFVQAYEPTGHARRGRFDCKKLSRHEDYPFGLTTYDWSPSIPGLVAMGTTEGNVQLLRIDDNSNAVMELKLRSPRLCHAVAFNTGNLLAVGLDRVRNDQSLHIWDVSRSTLDPDTLGFPLDNSAILEPIQRLEPGASVTSVKFFEDNPQTLAVGIKNQSIRIYDLRDPNGSVITYQTRLNNNIAIDYADQNYFASSALDQAGVVIWDRRTTSRPSASPVYLDAIDKDNLPWGAALKIDKAIDMDLNNTEERNSLIRSVRFCRDRRGLLAVLSRTGQFRVIDTQKEFTSQEVDYEGSPELLQVRKSHDLDIRQADQDKKNDRIVSFDWVNLESPALTPRALVLRNSGAFDILEVPHYTTDHIYKLVPWQAPYRGLQEGSSYHSIMEFEQYQAPTMLGPLIVQQALSDVPIFGDQKVDVDGLIQKALQPHHAFPKDYTEDTMTIEGQLSDFFVKGSSTAQKLQGLRSFSRQALRTAKSENLASQPQGDLEDLTQSMDTLLSGRTEPPSNRQLHEKLLSQNLDARGFPKEAQILLDHILLYRAHSGYLLNPAINRDMLSDDPWLRDLWDWIGGAENDAIEGNMTALGLDLSYMGVRTVWANDLGEESSSRLTAGTPVPDRGTWERCLQTINHRVGSAKYDGAKTKWPAHRQACIRIIGLGRSPKITEDDYHKTPASERTPSWHTMATAHALFAGDTDQAIDLLKKASSEHPELLFVSLALQLIGQNAGLAREQLDFDDAVASKTDPYLRAISSLIATNDWETIANQESLPMRERTYVALRYFDDDKLTKWLDKLVNKCIHLGDVEGIVLTGITDKLVDIFATYVEKFNDFQTATLVLSICAPRYINDYRCLVWRNAYRAYLQRHKAFYQRTKFEVESTKRSRRGGVPTVKPPSRQIALRCVFCDAEYELSKTGATGPSAASTQRNPLMASNVNAGVSCPNCGRHLPRCVVCLEVVGIPRSEKPGADADKRAAPRFPTFCLKCEHVTHLDHARQWFARHVECPVPECRCRCNFRANPELNYH